jgi:hypothetical protein
VAASAGGKLLSFGVAAVTTSCTVVAIGVVAYAMNRDELRMVVAWLRQWARPRAS